MMKQALDMLQSQLEEVGRANQIERFSSACSLRDAIDSGKYFDLIFMDIELSELQNGIDFASSVNETCPDIQIVFVTGHPDCYYQQIFLKQINLCGYLEKPVDRNVLKKLLQKGLEIIRKRESQKLLIQQNGTVNAIPNSKIQYIESSLPQTYTVSVANVQQLCLGCGSKQVYIRQRDYQIRRCQKWQLFKIQKAIAAGH